MRIIIGGFLTLVLAVGCASSQKLSTTVTPAFQVEVYGSGHPMILVPGLSCSGEVWHDLVEHYKNRYEIHVLTLAGFGGSPSVAPPFLDSVRQELIHYIREKKLDHPVLIGHSLGGFMVLWVGSTAPELVGSIVAVDGVPFLPALGNDTATPISTQEIATRVRDMFAGLTQEQFAKQNQQSLKTLITDPQKVDWVAASSGKSDPKAVGQAIFELMTTDIRTSVEAITAPTVMLAAGGLIKDKAKANDVMKKYEKQIKKIKNHKLIMASNARHFIMLDDPDLLYKQIDTVAPYPSKGQNHKTEIRN